MNKKLMKAVLTAANIFGGLGAFSFSAFASTLPDATMNTPGYTSLTTDTRTLYQSGGAGSIFAQASLANLTATARIDATPALSTVTYATVTYYMELASSTGAFPNDYFFTIPLVFSASGFTDVGGIPPTVGSSFNHNHATADLRFNGYSVSSACAGYGCWANAPTSLTGGQVDLRPGSSSSGYGANIFQVSIEARADTNSNYPTSYAYAWADPTIQIEPTFLAAHPEYSLSFSSNLPAAVPVPAAVWLFGSGLLGLMGVARRKKIA
jgi:hypothetical protein